MNVRVGEYLHFTDSFLVWGVVYDWKPAFTQMGAEGILAERASDCLAFEFHAWVFIEFYV